MGGVSDLTSQEGSDKSVGQRAKEGVQGLTGQQSQHCLCRLAAWPAAAAPGWPLCPAKFQCACATYDSEAALPHVVGSCQASEYALKL